jgi:hypothetical protein
LATVLPVNQEEFEDTKEVIRMLKWKKDRQHNGQKKREKRTNNDLQSIHIQHLVTRTPLKTGGILMCFGMEGSSCSTRGTRGLTLVTNPMISDEGGEDWILITFLASSNYLGTRLN